MRRLVCVSVNAAIDKTAAVPRLVAGEIHRPQMLSVLPGGKALNVARAARTLGLEASVIAVLGGCAGDWMEQQLAARGIRTRAVRVPGETRTCLSILDREKGGLTEFYEAGLELRTEGWASVESALRAELADDPSGALVVIAGSLPPGAPLDGYGRLSGIAAELGARAAVDVGGAHLTAALPLRPWLVKVNAREAAEACGWAEGADDGEGGSVSPDGAAGAALELRRRGATVALVTRGTRGGSACGRGRSPMADRSTARARPVSRRQRRRVAGRNGRGPGPRSASPRGRTRGGGGGLRQCPPTRSGELDRADVARILAGISLAQM